MVFVFTAAVFLSATLLFLVQPMVARLVLPLLGGTPGVWNTCMLFFQTLLLTGYAYAHALTKIRSGRVQVAVHALAALGALATLPIGLPFVRSAPPGEPVLWLLGTLALTAGAPFSLLSTTGPLLQRWFADTDHRSARDPYFLYAASNAGSLIALLGYPLLVEPFVTLKNQTGLWSVAVVVLVALLLTAGIMHVPRRATRPASLNTLAQPDTTQSTASSNPSVPSLEAARAIARPTTPRTVLIWVLLAAAPSSLMLGVTSFISTDLAAVPLLWIGPLAIYLLTMIIAFSRWGPRATRLASAALPFAVIGLVVSVLMMALRPIEVLVGVHLLVLLIASTACHGRLAAQRPDASKLTAYFLWISVGGALGGLFNAVLAPVIFTRIAEYPITLVLACALGLGVGQRSTSDIETTSKTTPKNYPLARWFVSTFAYPVAATGLLVLCSRASIYFAFNAKWKSDAISFVLPALACFLFIRWPLRFTLTIAGFFIIAAQTFSSGGTLLHTQRGFFGVLRVIENTYATGHAPTASAPNESKPDATQTPDPLSNTAPEPPPRSKTFHQLLHGSTAHGLQLVDPVGQDIPLTYYHPSGPAGLVFLSMIKADRLHNVGLVGLGTGALAAYGLPESHFTFFEINPAMVELAQDPKLFTYLQRSQAQLDIRLGDGRRSIASFDGKPFDLIVLDAFSSDSIPIHLLTVEAVRIYLDHLAPRGVILVHISNRHLRLQPVVRGIANRLGLVGREFQDDPSPAKAQEWADEGKYASYWIVLARSEADFDFLGPDARWLKFLPPKTPDPVWTDDFSNILSVLNLGA